MTNYYFISSPFHLFLSCNLAIQNSQDKNIAIVVPRILSKSKVSDTYRRALAHANKIFTQFVSFEILQEETRNQSRHQQRKYRFKQIKKLLTELPADRIYTGNDRRLEFQFAMSVASKENSELQGIYLDEGMATYLGHKSMHSIQHKYIDPFLKKLVYGWWWKNPITIGSSGWINTIYVAFPNHIHPTLKNKDIRSVEHHIFNNPLFIDFCRKNIDENEVSTKEIENYQVLIVLTHESFYPGGYSYIKELINKAKQWFDENDIAIKAHPRSECNEQIITDFPDCKHASHKVGFEMMLPVLNKNCLVVGDVSTAVFTTRWLRPELRVVAIKIDDNKRAFIHNELEKLYKKINVPLKLASDNWLT